MSLYSTLVPVKSWPGVVGLLGGCGAKDIWTRRCRVCAQAVRLSQCADGMCAECDMELQPRVGGFCPACGLLYAFSDIEPYLCAQCRKTYPPWDGFGFLNAYVGVLRDMILDFKFYAHFERRQALRSLLQRAHAYHFQGLCPECIIPVPLHKRRLRERGFNQSLEIARTLSRSLNVPIQPWALERMRWTKAQSGLERKERQKNVRGAFRAAPDRVQGKHILLVDDVSTTGATLQACVRTLRQAGAQRVDVLVLAVAPG